MTAEPDPFRQVEEADRQARRARTNLQTSLGINRRIRVVAANATLDRDAQTTQVWLVELGHPSSSGFTIHPVTGWCKHPTQDVVLVFDDTGAVSVVMNLMNRTESVELPVSLTMDDDVPF